MIAKVPKEKRNLSYKDAGVDRKSAYKFLKKIKPDIKNTKRPEILSEIGSFFALSRLPANIKNPVLVSCTDGVGTKIEIAKEINIYNTIGIDLVAMSVNDLITCGAEPLLFLDYYVTDSLNVSVASEVISGIAEGCKQARCSLVGGETAEHPDSFPTDSFDLAGFCVGVVDETKIIGMHNANEGDVLIGIASSGFHSNGFSLIRKVLNKNSQSLKQNIGESSLGRRLLTPTKIYVSEILKLIKKIKVSAIAHITGGGFYENIPRILKYGTKAKITYNYKDWPNHDLFNWIQSEGNIKDKEMFSTFNCGVGMVISVQEKDTKKTLNLLNQFGLIAKQIGLVESKLRNESTVKISLIR
tara:strand:- start:6189 stop:7256 length:1068 start_codon:yes stop_codon:yes gene_type:complete